MRKIGIFIIVALMVGILVGKLILNKEQKREKIMKNIATMIIVSPSFEHNSPIPEKFTCDGGNMNPELKISNVPEGAKSLALILDDPDAPNGTFTHWIVWNIDPKTDTVKEESTPPGATEGANSSGQNGYTGPCPPNGLHHYRFKIFALDTKLDLIEGAAVHELMNAMEPHIIGRGELIGTYTRYEK